MARCPRQTKTATAICQPFVVKKEKKSTSVTSYPTDPKESSSLPTLNLYINVYKTILQKNSCVRKWERSHSPNSHVANRKKWTEFYHLIEYFRKVLFLICVLFMLTFTDSRVYRCIVYMRASSFFLAFRFFSLQLIYWRRLTSSQKNK